MRPVNQYTKDNIFVAYFNSMESAVLFLNLPKKASAHISKCCTNKKPTAYSYKWQYA